MPCQSSPRGSKRAHRTAYTPTMTNASGWAASEPKRVRSRRIGCMRLPRFQTALLCGRQLEGDGLEVGTRAHGRQPTAQRSHQWHSIRRRHEAAPQSKSGPTAQPRSARLWPSEIHAALPVLNPCAPPPKSAPARRRYFPILGSNLQLVRHALGPHESSSSVLMHLAPPAAADLSPFHPLEGRAAVSSQARSFPAALGLASYKLAVYWSDYPRHQKQSSAWNQSHSHGPTPRPSPTEIREFCAQRAGIAFQISRCRRQAPSLPLRQTTMYLSRGVCPELSFRCASPTS